MSQALVAACYTQRRLWLQVQLVAANLNIGPWQVRLEFDFRREARIMDTVAGHLKVCIFPYPIPTISLH